MTTLIELEHLHNETDAALGSLTEAVDTIWTLVMAIVILLMQGGFAMLEAGAVRERSVRDILLKNIMDVSVCAMVWAAFGSMLASDTHGSFLGWRVLPNDTETPFEAIDVAQGEDKSIYFLGYLYAATSSTIVSGAIAERTQQRAYIILSCAMAGLIYPAVVHWLWTDRGWLSWTNEDAVLGGAYDFAGASVVHLTGGVVALLAAKIVGPRAGRFHARDQPPNELRGHSSALSVLGTFLLTVGWLGFNLGSIRHITLPGAPQIAAQTAVCTSLSGSAGCLAAIGVMRCRRGTQWSLEHACNGWLAGLVSITACASVVDSTISLVVGALGGFVYCAASHVVANVLRVDDVLDAFAVHGACGCWSMLAAGFLANGAAIVGPGPLGTFYGGDGQLIAANLLAVVSISAWALLLGTATLMPLHRAGLMRISAEFETTGIDVSEIGRAAYSSGAEADGQPVLAASREVFAASDMENMAPDAAPVVAVRVTGATGAGVELVGPRDRIMPPADVAEGSPVDGVHDGASQETGRDS
jgi:Amt family ammonium transporter